MGEVCIGKLGCDTLCLEVGYCYCGYPLCEGVGQTLNILFTDGRDTKKCSEQPNTLRYITFEGRFPLYLAVWKLII